MTSPARVTCISHTKHWRSTPGFIEHKAFDSAYVFGMTSTGVPGGPARATLFYVLNLYLKAFNYFHMGLASAMAWLLFTAILLLTWLNFRLAKRWVHTG